MIELLTAIVALVALVVLYLMFRRDRQAEQTALSLAREAIDLLRDYRHDCLDVAAFERRRLSVEDEYRYHAMAVADGRKSPNDPVAVERRQSRTETVDAEPLTESEAAAREQERLLAQMAGQSHLIG